MRALLVCLVACTPANPHPTPLGTTVLTWDLAKSDRASIRTAALSGQRMNDLDYVAHPTDDTSIALKIHLETGTAVYTEDNQEVMHTTPTKLAVELVDGGDFTLGDCRCMGPHYKLAAPGAAPRDMILHCIVHVTKPRVEASVTLYLYGDGRVDDGR